MIQELGNKAFINKNYDEAVDFYSKAIEVDPNDPVYFSNSKQLPPYLICNYKGATVYFEMELFDKCIEDCDRAIELKKDFSKVRYQGFPLLHTY